MATLKEKPGRGDKGEFVYLTQIEPPEKGQRLHFDDHRDAPRGFGIRVTPVKSKDGEGSEPSIAFILKYAIDGRQRRLSIGQYPTWSLAAARDHAGELAREIDQGNDPLEEKERRRADPTLAEALEGDDGYLIKYVSGLASAKPISRYFTRDVMPVLGKKKLTDVTRRDLIDLIEEKAAQTPTAARHLLAYMKKFFDWCVERDMIEFSPAIGIKPKSITVAGKKNILKSTRRKRTLSDGEIRQLWRADCGIHPLTMLALKLVLVTGQRPGEVVGMHQSEIRGDVWTIPASRRGKTETEHVVGLSPLAVELIDQARVELQRLSKRRGSTSAGYLFEARPGKPLAVDALSKAVKRHREAMGNQDHEIWGHWTPHDLRRTCRTGLAACGVSDEISERVIGHKTEAIVDTYNTFQYIEEKRRALTVWESRLRAILAGDDPGNVVSIMRVSA